MVTDETGLEKISNLFSAIMPGEVKGFALSQLAEAESWVGTE